MTMFTREIVLLFFLFIATIVLASVIIRLRASNKDNTAAMIVLVTLILIEAFIIIHLFFCYQWGFPASLSQNNATDLTLVSSDWLAFLSGYLSFAGSLVMAYLVYRQGKIIDKLTISEYRTPASLIIRGCIRSSDDINFHGENILQPLPGTSNHEYFTLQCRRTEQEEALGDHRNYELLVFAEISNNSKASISKLSFSKIEITSTQGNGKHYLFNRCKNTQPLDNLEFDIHPGHKMKYCFMLVNIPHTITLSWMNIVFKYGSNQTLILKLLMQSIPGENPKLYSISQ